MNYRIKMKYVLSDRRCAKWRSVSQEKAWYGKSLISGKTLRAGDLATQSAAFDAVVHSILLSRLHDRFGVNGTAAAWFESYLTSRTQFVRVSDCIPQSSVLGPLLYLLYTSPIAAIIKFHKLQYHLYADDTQLYISFRTDCSYDLSLAFPTFFL